MQNQIKMKVKTPYNFVALNEKVYFPFWAEYTSQDLPFSDGESGHIDFKISNHSPFFIGSSHLADGTIADKNNKGSKENPLVFPGAYKNGPGAFIPGSSLKGLLRNSLSTVSFGKIKGLSKTKQSFRDLSGKGPNYALKSNQKSIKAGWLKQVNGQWLIEDCGVPGRISHAQIDKKLGTNFVETFKKGRTESDFFKKEDHKLARYKYLELERIQGPGLFKDKVGFLKDGPVHKIYQFGEGENEASLILTGQPGERDKDAPVGKDGKGTGKFYEFLFFPATGNSFAVEAQERDNFLEAMFEYDVAKTNKDWQHWKKQLKEGGKIPVFFRNNGRKVIDFGLSFLYKMPYKHAPADLVSADHQVEDKYDLAELLFGRVGENENISSLKGRVHVGHASLITGEFMGTKSFLLASPRASYYPFYVKQSIKNGRVDNFSSYDRDTARIAGRKFYPVAKEVENYKGENNEQMLSHIKPLKTGATFKGSIYFHNLRPVEIGALLSVLSFHRQEGYFHKLGMAKPLGYGKIKINYKLKDLKHNVDDYIAAFEETMSNFLGNPWANNRDVKEYFTLHADHKNINQSRLGYFEDVKEFAALKIDKTENALESFSVIAGLDQAAELVPTAEQAKLDYWSELRENGQRQFKIAAAKSQLEIAEQKERKLKAEAEEQAQLLAIEKEKLKKKEEEERKQEEDRIQMNKERKAKEASSSGLSDISLATDDAKVIKYVEQRYLKSIGLKVLPKDMYQELFDILANCAKSTNKKVFSKRFEKAEAPIYKKMHAWGIDQQTIEEFRSSLNYES